jgi:hypothetical protein
MTANHVEHEIATFTGSLGRGAAAVKKSPGSGSVAGKRQPHTLEQLIFIFVGLHEGDGGLGLGTRWRGRGRPTIASVTATAPTRGPCLCQRRAPGSTAQKPGFGKPRFLSTGTESGKSPIGRWARFHIPGVVGSSGASAGSSPASTNPLEGLSELSARAAAPRAALAL